jgi:hypothetical protein
MVVRKGEADALLKAKLQAKAKQETEKILKQELQDEYDKEKLECSICKRMIQRSCIHEHQKHQHVESIGYCYIKHTKDFMNKNFQKQSS